MGIWEVLISIVLIIASLIIIAVILLQQGRQTLILSNQHLIHLCQQFDLLFHVKPSLQFFC